MERFSDYIVYVDESGHASAQVDPLFPCFVLAFCLFEKQHYWNHVVPGLQKMKFEFFGHDMVIFHERDIRKCTGQFSVLSSRLTRKEFMRKLNLLIERSQMAILSDVIIKTGRHKPEDNLYHQACSTCLEGLYEKLERLGEKEKIVHVVFEQRGKQEDQLLELEFRRICSGDNTHQTRYPFEPVFASKKCNSSGLQFADLFARPIGLATLRPEQPNRAYDLIKEKDLLPVTDQVDLFPRQS